jgi:cyclic pyranopterin monophosphate synthase
VRSRHVTEHPETKAKMVDVSGKAVTAREAVASGVVVMSQPTRDLLVSRSLDKGDALEVARIAGIMAAKKTSELIPLCHPIAIEAVELGFEERDEGIGIVATVRTSEKTGVEMEALTAVSIAALTIYDMCKAIDKTMSISDIHLVSKTGGTSKT